MPLDAEIQLPHEYLKLGTRVQNDGLAPGECTHNTLFVPLPAQEVALAAALEIKLNSVYSGRSVDTSDSAYFIRVTGRPPRCSNDQIHKGNRSGPSFTRIIFDRAQNYVPDMKHSANIRFVRFRSRGKKLEQFQIPIGFGLMRFDHFY